MTLKSVVFSAVLVGCTFVACGPRASQSVPTALSTPAAATGNVDKRIQSTGPLSSCVIYATLPEGATCHIAPGDTLNLNGLIASEDNGPPDLKFPAYKCTVGTPALQYTSGTVPVAGLSISGSSSGAAADCGTVINDNFVVTAASNVANFSVVNVQVHKSLTICTSSTNCAPSVAGMAVVVIYPAATPTPSPSPSPTPPCLSAFTVPATSSPNYAAVVALNGYINGSPPLQALVRYLSAHNALPVPKATSLPANVAARVTTHGTELDWDMAHVGEATNAGHQDATQILYHELVHVYDVLYWGVPPSGGANGGIPVMTATIGTTMWTFPSTEAGLGAYEHAYVHNAMLNAYNSDRTGALISVFSVVDPQHQAADVTQYAGSSFSFSLPGANPVFPPTTYACPGTQSHMRGPRDVLTFGINVPAPEPFDDVY